MSKAFHQVGNKVPIEGTIMLLLEMVLPQTRKKVKDNFYRITLSDGHGFANTTTEDLHFFQKGV